MRESSQVTIDVDPTLSETQPAETAPMPATPLAVEGDRMPPPDGSSVRIWEPGIERPSYFFLITVSILSLAADIGTKLWAEHRPNGPIEIWKDHVTLLTGAFTARNRGGAWGLLQNASEDVRRPFFLLVSVAAIAFIMTLYRRLLPRQRALRWGLPLVLGGALGNVFDRIRYGHVIDFIDVHAVWKGIDHHWPTFNVADIAICVGVGLMAVDMFTSKRARGAVFGPKVPPAQAGEPAAIYAAPTAAAAPAPEPAPAPETPPEPPTS